MQDIVAVISTETVVRNADILSRAAKKSFFAVVKDDAYGHGAEQIALALQPRAGAFAVSKAEEGAALRTAGVTADILVLTPPLDGADVARIRAYDLIATLSSRPVLALAAGKYIRAHIAVNTGMNRYGVPPQEAERFARAAKERGIAVEGVYSHLYDAADTAARSKQAALFFEACAAVRKVFPAAISHLSATGGAISGDGFDAVRLGIGLYGYLPAGFEGKANVSPAAKFYARVAQSGTFLGGGVGYAKTNKRYSFLHTLRLGYGDGFFRAGGEGAIGSLCMDACIREGKAAFGAWKQVLKDVPAYARAHGTIPYEVLVNVLKKAVKVYV